ncbi:unnamed protein product [Fusarium venenatum]|uniref:Alcohol dehydrogenase-like N-terminal domain-containing protein n=1 Tax=Fusarium venenatum TaxID=56646 RepID=A0A2L2TU77_9HYPO|nr:uncharacterized protein FVRRES_04188 [Fusarium venenatum]CEI67676.1 unnamed protein product [Fusarium venenatum]
MESTALIQQGKTFAQEQIILPHLAEHQVYVKVEYAAFNPTDRLALDVDAFGDGAVLGCDFSGTVVSIHSNVTKLQIGDKVAGFVWGAHTCIRRDQRLRGILVSSSSVFCLEV